MAKEWARSFYNSQAWKDCREAYISSVYGLCEKCNGPGYIVHHKIHLTPTNVNDPGVTLNHEHLEYLCIDCHNSIHYRKIKGATREGLTFDNNGNLIKIF